MKASDLISQLAKYISKYGDQDVFVRDIKKYTIKDFTPVGSTDYAGRKHITFEINIE